RLVPPELNGYATIQNVHDELNKDASAKMTTNLLVFFDEFKFNKKTDAVNFRAFVSNSLYDFRTPYGKKNVKRDRIASGCGATNELNFIDDAENNRRLIPVLITHIDHVKYNAIDKAALFREAYKLFCDGEPYL